MRHLKLYEQIAIIKEEKFIEPGSVPDHYKNEFENKLKDILNEVGNDSEQFYMGMSIKMDEWMDNYRYDKQNES